MSLTDNEAWIVDTGLEIIVKKTDSTIAALSPREKLIYCIWVVDYCIRNAGDLIQADDIYNGYKSEILSLSELLDCRTTWGLFSLTDEQIVAIYYSRFDAVCNEIRAIKP